MTTIKVDLHLSTLKLLHAEAIKNAFNDFVSCRGKEIIKAGWKASNAIHKTRTQRVNVINLNPFT